MYIYSGFRVVEFSGQLQLLGKPPRRAQAHKLVISGSAPTQASQTGAKENTLRYKLLTGTGSVEGTLATQTFDYGDWLNFGGRNRTDLKLQETE